MPKTRIVRSKADENPPILKENEIVKFANLIDGGEHYWSYVEYVVEEQENVQQLEKSKHKKKELCEYEGIKFEVELEYYYDDMIGEYYYVDSELGNENLRKIREEYGKIIQRNLDSENKKLKKAIAILNRIYGFKLQDIKYSGYYELLIPDMTSDELSKEEYELLEEVMENVN